MNDGDCGGEQPRYLSYFSQEDYLKNLIFVTVTIYKDLKDNPSEA